jgi:hypothetical protein
MPFKSRAQRRKFAQLLVEGKISDKTFEEWNRETGSKKLPEHVRKTASRKRTPVKRGRRLADRAGQPDVSDRADVNPDMRLGPRSSECDPRLRVAAGGILYP